MDDKGNPSGGGMGGFGGFQGGGGGFGGFQSQEDLFEELAGVFGGRGNSRRKGAGRDINIAVGGGSDVAAASSLVALRVEAAALPLGARAPQEMPKEKAKQGREKV